MGPSTYNEICVDPKFGYAIGGDRPTGAVQISDNDLNFLIIVNIIHTYTCGKNTVEENNYGDAYSCEYNSLSWDIIDEMLSTTKFPYPLERIKWNPTQKILENKNDLIKQTLEYAHQKITTRPPLENMEVVFVSLEFVKQVSISPQEFEVTKARILAAEERERYEELLWDSIYDKIIKRSFRAEGLSLYKEFKLIECYIKEIVSGISQENKCFDENYERELIKSFIKEARKEFRLLYAVKSKIKFLKKVNLSSHDDICSICMEKYLPHVAEEYSMPCSHSFHFNCIETWLLKDPSCPMCRYKLPAMEIPEVEMELNELVFSYHNA